MKIAITGGAGFVGSHLVKAYLDAGQDVFVIDSLVHGSRQNVDRRARFYQLDIRDSKLQEVLQLERPDIVSHHVGQHALAFPAESLLADADVQLRGLLNVLEGCVSASVTKLIYASNGCTFYRPLQVSASSQKLHIATEEVPLFPQSHNDISKLAGEWYVRYYTRRFALQHTILRYAYIYGEPDSEAGQHPLTYFASMLSRGQRPVMREPALDERDHIYIDDVVRANINALERARNCTLHISTGEGYTREQFFRAAAAHFSSDLLPVYFASAQVEPTSLVLDNTLARQQLGWQPEIGFAEGVRRAIEILHARKVISLSEESPALAPVKKAVLVHS
jgi:UDP-glucose 4-epimerase